MSILTKNVNCNQPKIPNFFYVHLAWKKEQKIGGLAWSFYNSSGERLNSHSEPAAYVISSLVAEGLAIRSAMEHAMALQLSSVVFESDSLQLVSAIVDDSSYSEIHGILSDIRLLSSSFISVSFRFTPRENLLFEDGMAKQVLSDFVLNPV
ncbi:hypothetical protein Bca4012_082061 [Brassica carinata]